MDPNPRGAGRGARGELGAAPIMNKPLAARGAGTPPVGPAPSFAGSRADPKASFPHPNPLPSLPSAASLPPPRTPSPEGGTVAPLPPRAPGAPAGTVELAGCRAPQATFRGPPAPRRAAWPPLGFLGKPAWSSAQPPHTWACTGGRGRAGRRWACARGRGRAEGSGGAHVGAPRLHLPSQLSMAFLVPPQSPGWRPKPAEQRLGGAEGQGAPWRSSGHLHKLTPVNTTRFASLHRCRAPKPP